MKSTKQKKAFATTEATEDPIVKLRQLTAVQMVNAEFDAFCQVKFPAEYSDPDDQHVLRCVWMAAVMQSAGQLIKGTVEPLQATARQEFDRLMGVGPVA